MWKVWSWQQGRENTKPTPSNRACPTPGVLSVVWHLPLSPKGKSPKWTPGKAGSLLVLPNCWEGKWNSKLLKQHWVECTEERSHLCKAKVRTVSLWHSPTCPQRIKGNLSVAFSVGHQLCSVPMHLCPVLFLKNIKSFPQMRSVV